YRVNVLGGKVIGAFHRRALSIVGDGIHTIQELLQFKNYERKSSPFLAKKTIKIDPDMEQLLLENALDRNSILEKGRRIYLRRNGEYFSQRDAVDVTDKLSKRIKE